VYLTSSRSRAAWTLPLMLSAAILVVASPELGFTAFGTRPPYLAVTIVLTVLIAAIAAAQRSVEAEPSGVASHAVAAAIVGASAAAVVAIAAYRWTRLAVWLPYQADMLIVIREATRRFLDGHSPYVVYRAYDAPWDMAMPYGPALWGPYVAAQLLRLDFRLFSIAGELFVPVWCGIAAAIEAARGRMASAAAWLTVLAALVVMLDVQRFTLIGHTPVYWPLFPALAVAMTRSRWTAAACLVGVLVIARTTMAAMVPVFLFAVFTLDKKRFAAAFAAMAATAAIGLAPFAIADFGGLWDSMVMSYPRVMKNAVWPVLAKPGLETIGVTEWLLETHRESLIVPAQIAAMLIAYAAAVVAICRRAPPLPWMALALFAFSMTTLYPVHYLYYDVLLLLVADAVAQTVDPAAVPRVAAPWLFSLAAIGTLVAVIVRVAASPFPSVIASDAARNRELRSGFSSIEYDGGRTFSWIVGHEARVVLPRSSAAAADIVLTAESPVEADQPPQRMSAMLNGVLLGEITIPAGRQQIRIAAGRGAWWIGYNELRLMFASTVVPREVGAGSDRRPLALSIAGITIEPHVPLKSQVSDLRRRLSLGF
jgi:hypothetical protein